MTESFPARPSPVPRFLSLLLLLFLGSGCAALIYEIVWFQLLQLVIGSSAISLAVLLGTFMGGMCLGSLALPRLIPATIHPLRVYAVLELGIALLGLLVLWTMPSIGRAYGAMVGPGAPGILLRAGLCMVMLLPPTVLMGATLPAISRWIESTPRGVSWLGFFYAGNTFGAVGGCLLAGFYLLRVYDMPTATYCAVAINAGVAGLAAALARRVGHQATLSVSVLRTKVIAPAVPMALLIATGLSGFCALAAEVIWTRILSLMLGATVYTFSMILAVFLTGLGIGSSLGSLLAQRTPHSRRALGVCHLAQIAAIGWAAYSMSCSLPYWSLQTPPAEGPLGKFLFDLMRTGWAILPSALLWGASFPLALNGMAEPGQDPARLVGRAYAANTLGAIFGAVAASMLLIPALGTRDAQVILLGLSLATAIIAFPAPRLAATLPVTGAALLATIAALTLPEIPWQLVAYGRQTATTDYGAKAIYLGEGMNASVAVSETQGGARFFHVSGKTEASSLLKDMRLQRMLGHIPALLHPNPRSVLIVGCGAGVTAGSFVLHPSINRIVICDIEPLIPRVVAGYFRKENYDVVNDPRVEIVYDDARHFIATTKEKFDLITSDPIHPWVKGSAVLYSQEYFELCRQRLNPGGLLTQWVPLYEADRAVVQSEIATFFSVFPDGTIWGNDDDGFGYDTVMLGHAGPWRIDVDELQARFERPDHALIRSSLADLDLGSAVDLLATYTGRHADLKTWLATAEINRDRNLRLQYLAGLQLDSPHGAGAYDEMLSFRRFPADMFVASPERLKKLRLVLEPRPAN